MDTTRYKVVFSGEIVPGQHIEEVKKRIAALYKVPVTKCDHLFTREVVTIKENLDYVTAVKYKDAFEKTGAICNIEKIEQDIQKIQTKSGIQGARTEERQQQKNHTQREESEDLETFVDTLEKIGNTHDPSVIPKLIKGIGILTEANSSGEKVGIALGSLARIPGGLKKLELSTSPERYQQIMKFLISYVGMLEDYVADGFPGFAPKLNEIKKTLVDLGIDVDREVARARNNEAGGNKKMCQQCGKPITGHRAEVQFFDDSGDQSQLCMDCLNKRLNIAGAKRPQAETPIESKTTTPKGIQIKQGVLKVNTGLCNHNGICSKCNLHEAAKFGDVEGAKALLANGADVNALFPAADNETPLHRAATSDDLNNEKTTVVDLLLANGANLEAKNNYGHTPLHCAVINSKVNFVKYLVKHGANVHATALKNYTALHFVALSAIGKENKKEMAEILLAHGAILEAKDIEGFTPLEIARKKERPQELIKVLGGSSGGSSVGGSSGGSSGCFIANACYGSLDCWQVKELRRFRDEQLLSSQIGSFLVACYYYTSPPIARYIQRKPLLRFFAKTFIVEPLVKLISHPKKRRMS